MLPGAIPRRGTAGRPRRHTGHAEGPHLHLQLEPANGYPQDEPWFQSFAGTAFSWLDSTQTNAAPNPVFAVVGDAPKPLGASTAPLRPPGRSSTSPLLGVEFPRLRAEGTTAMSSFVPRLLALTVVWFFATAALTFQPPTDGFGPLPHPPPVTKAAPAVRRRILVVPDLRRQAFVFSKGTLEPTPASVPHRGPVKGSPSNTVVSQTPAPGTR